MSYNKIAIAISSFRSNAEAKSLVSKIVHECWPCEYILVVDSFGTGEFEEFISSIDVADRILYFNNDVNLGSAGNLHKRLVWANELGMDFVLALNHDAEITHSVYIALSKNADKLSNIGALYPLRYRKGKKLYDLSGEKVLSIGVHGSTSRPTRELIEVFWSSSNGALYSTEPLRRVDKLCPDASLWMGWEDYLYGLQLRDAGYRQCIVTSAETVDNYEYKTVNLSMVSRPVADKPMWYSYYDPRNLILIAFYRIHSPALTVRILFRVFLGLLLVPFKFKRQKKMAVMFYLAGIRDGVRNAAGKWKLP